VVGVWGRGLKKEEKKKKAHTFVSSPFAFDSTKINLWLALVRIVCPLFGRELLRSGLNEAAICEPRSRSRGEHKKLVTLQLSYT